MAKRIKGITIELDGETKGLDKALQDVNKRSRNLNSELRDVERLLKFDPGNAEAVAQKQKLLADQVENTSDKLSELRKAQKQVEKQFQRGDIGEDQYRAFQREVQFTEAELRKFQKRLDSVDDGKSLNNAEKDMRDIKKETDKAEKSAKDLGDSFKTVAKTAAGIGAAGAASIGGLVEGMEEYNTSMARLDTNAKAVGISIDDVSGAFEQMKLVSDETDSSVEAVSNLIAAGFDPSGITQATDAIAGAAIQWSDTLNVEGLSDGLQETLALGEATGMFAEMLERSGMDLDTFNAGLAEATASGKNQQYVLDQLTNLELADFFDAYKEGNPELIAQKEATENLNSELSELATTLSPLVTMVKNFVSEIVAWLNESAEFIKSFDSIGEGFQAFLTDIVQQGMNLISTLADTIIQNMPLIIETGMQILKNIIQGIIQAVPQLFEAWQQILTMQAENIKTFLPQIIELGVTLLQSLINGLVTALPILLEAVFMLLTNLVTVVLENLPMIINAGINILNSLIDGIVKMLPQLMEMALELITTLLSVLLANLPKIINAGIELLKSLIEGITGMLPELIKMALTLILELVGELIANLPMIIAAGVDIIFALIEGLLDAIPDIINMIPEIVEAIFDAFGEVDWGEIGTNIMEGLIDGITSMAGSLVENVKGVVDSAVDAAKNLLGIASPSKVFREIGEFTGEGLEQGIMAMGNRVSKAGENLASASIPNQQSMNAQGNMISNNGGLNADNGETVTLLRDIVTAIREGQIIQVDGRSIQSVVNDRNAVDQTGKFFNR